MCFFLKKNIWYIIASEFDYFHIQQQATRKMMLLFNALLFHQLTLSVCCCLVLGSQCKLSLSKLVFL